MMTTTLGTDEMTSARRHMPSRGKNARAPQRFNLTNKLIDGLLVDVQSGRIPKPNVTISDPEQTGLRVMIRNSGTVSFHVHYEIESDPDSGMRTRPWLTVGHYPDMTIPEARELAKTILSLAEKGIDPQDGLHDRLIRELKEKGTRWRP